MSVQRRGSRPSSATSHASRVSNSGQSDYELRLECKAAFLGLYDDLKEEVASKDDLTLLLQQTGRNPSSKVIARYWINDTDGMTFDDFVEICRREPVTSEDELMKAFRKIDLNGDGYISLDELFKIMTTRGEKMSRAEVKEMIDEVDDNRDGRLDYREFAKMVVSTSEDFKKMSIKEMERKERRKTKRRDGDITPRKDKDELSLGSQLSIRSAASDNKKKNRDRRASQLSLKSNAASEAADKENQSRRASQLSLNINSPDDDLSRPSPRARRDSRPKSAGKGGRSAEPGNLREWTALSSKGTFFMDEDNSTLSHVFSLNLTEDSDVYITIQPLRIGESGESLDGTVIDTALLVLSEDDNSFIAFTENKDSRGKYSLRCSLSQGNYLLLPFTTGCRLRPRRDVPTKEAKLISKDKDGKIVITRAFRKALEEIFEMADLDGNGYLSRDEFNWYNLRISGEDIADDEWQVVEDNIELERGEITRAGFIKLNEMEADDNDGDTDDLWITLTGMGFNKSLLIDEACPFMLKVYAQDCPDPELRVVGLESSKDKASAAFTELAIAKGEPTKVRGMKDMTVYQYSNDHRAIIVVDNKSKSRVKLELNCGKRRNVVSHTGSLTTAVTVPGHSAVVGHHILPLDDRADFSVVCEETILK